MFEKYCIACKKVWYAESLEDWCTHICEKNKVEDMVNHPKHYELLDGVEVLDVIKASLTTEQLKGYFMGNCIKYLCRSNKKNGDEDLAKMEFYAKELMDI